MVFSLLSSQDVFIWHVLSLVLGNRLLILVVESSRRAFYSQMAICVWKHAFLSEPRKFVHRQDAFQRGGYHKNLRKRLHQCIRKEWWAIYKKHHPQMRSPRWTPLLQLCTSCYKFWVYTSASSMLPSNHEWPSGIPTATNCSSKAEARPLPGTTPKSTTTDKASNGQSRSAHVLLVKGPPT